jgi:magnesium chelatase family protein
VTKLFCATFDGLDAKTIDVELSFTKGLPSFSIVGMASLAISESKERVKSALLNSKYNFPPKRITVNLSPSDIKKEGSHFDLVIALLMASQIKKIEPLEKIEWFVFGELGLDGSVKENQSLFALILSLANQNRLTHVMVPQESLEKLSHIPNINFYGISHLDEALTLYHDKASYTKEVVRERIQAASINYHDESYFYQSEFYLDFSDVKGQEVAKRAAMISAVGMHNILLEGSPGCGKSMIAKRLHYVLPPLSQHDLLEIAKLESLDGKTPSFSAIRPFRSPHHSATSASIFGGGSVKARIGEVGLSHLGVLFFDELPHFSKPVLEALREPLEDKKISISRVNAKIEYKTEFLFIGAMNPCPCGNLLHESLECRCSDVEVQRYKNRLSDPFLDRIDLYVMMQNVKSHDTSSISSKEIQERVLEAFMFAKQRGQNCLNGHLNDKELENFCTVEDDATGVLEQAISRFALSFRSINKVLKVARTIADLEQSEMIQKHHLLESLSYRRR